MVKAYALRMLQRLQFAGAVMCLLAETRGLRACQTQGVHTIHKLPMNGLPCQLKQMFRLAWSLGLINDSLLSGINFR